MADTRRTFQKGVMNQDLDERLLPNGSYISAENVTVNSYASGDVGAIQNAYGNLLKGNIITGTPGIASVINTPSITNPIVIGAVAYEPKGLIYWLVTANEFDAVFEYNIKNDQLIRVLQCSKPSPGSPLNFNSNCIVTGINYLEGQDGNNYLFWTDNCNPPRRININRCKGYTADDPSIADDISVIMAPPLNAPYISLSQNNSPDSTNLKEKFVYFSYRYKYIDNEYSSMSPFSAVGFEAGAFAIDYETGDNLGMVNRKNLIDIHFETGNEFVKEIQLLVRDTRSLNVMVIESFDKDKLFIQDNTTYSFTFRNNKIYTTLSNDQVTRLFDNVPLKALGQDIIGNRLIYGNYLQFRNITNANDVDININFTVKYVSETISGNNPKRSFRSDRDYEVGIVYTDEYGRMTTVLTPALSNSSNILSNALYIPPSASDKANSLQVEIKHNPPSWATNYRLVLKQNRHEYYNIFPRIYVCDGLFRYFLINESDRDKFGVGDYIILKKGSSGVTYSNKQFKILEVEVKAANFVSSAPAGLYFKIKIESFDVSFFQCNNSQTYATTNQGHNRGGVGTCSAYIKDINNVNISYGEGRYINKPVFYGSNQSLSSSLKTYNPGLIFPGVSVPAIATAPFYWGRQDLRYTIEIKPGNKFNYTVDLFGVSNWISPVDIPIVTNTLYSIKLPINVQGLNLFFSGQAINTAFFMSFSSNSFSVGDKWKISCRAEGFNGLVQNPTTGNVRGISYFNSSPNQLGVSDTTAGGVSVSTGDFSGPIYAGAQIEIKLIEDSGNSNLYSNTQIFTSPQTYENVEEWFVESGAFNNFIQNDLNGNNKKSQNIWFRNVNKSTTNQIVYTANPFNSQTTNFAIEDKTSNNIAMFLKGYGQSGGNQGQPNITKVEFKISQISPSNSIIFETVSLDTETEIFHELSRTYPIKNGNHISRWFFTGRSLGPFGSTRLTQSTKEWPHYFSVGDTVYINTNGVSPATAHTIVAISNRYSISVTPPMSISPSFPGSVSYTTYEQDQTSVTNGAKIQINYPNYTNGDYNSFTYNTGLETYRIKDAFNAPVMKYSSRVTTVIEDYEEEYKFSSLTYSGVFQASTSLNRLNEFNLSLANFKNLDKRYGSVQKLKARDTDLLVLHQDKITSVLYGKNLLYDAVGGSQIASIPEVLGNQIAYPGEFGISDNPESFATWGDVCYFADEKRGSVIKLIGNEVIPISTQGMGSFWIDTMRDNPNNFKFGGFDPYNGTYVISVSERQKQNCELSISPSIRSVNSGTSNGPVFMFSVDTMSPSWGISIVDNGYGTNWVNCQTVIGSYSQFVYASYASNPSNTPRSVIFRVTYCGGTLFKDFILTQGGVSAPFVIIPMVNG
jgi:hypothetical protein